jgi:hypothetical protein
VQLQQSTGNRVRVSVSGRCGPKYLLARTQVHCPPQCDGRPSRDGCCVAWMVLYVVRDIASFEKSHSVHLSDQDLQLRDGVEGSTTGSLGMAFPFALARPELGWASPRTSLLSTPRPSKRSHKTFLSPIMYPLHSPPALPRPTSLGDSRLLFLMNEPE